MSKLPQIDPTVPVRLHPVHIPKPWGQEIWYTGMEERGESRVAIDGMEVPISAYLRSAPQALTRSQPLLLLKILDPDPAEVLGDLYFEVHEEKQEVYVVTSVDPGAWPDGQGRMRFGMNQQMREDYGDDAAFRAAYLDAVADYEAIRRQIDELPDGSASAALAHREATARAKMNAFTATISLGVGDVVSVPTWTPHSLQHGIRVVEFQTQTYERYIISFAQRVLTQPHWDSVHAIERMHLETPRPATFEQVGPGIERIARFEDFNVWRVDTTAAGQLRLPSHVPYAVIMCIDGQG